MKNNSHFAKAKREINWISALITSVICGAIIFLASNLFDYNVMSDHKDEVYTAKIQSIQQGEKTETFEGVYSQLNELSVVITNGEYKGKETVVFQSVDGTIPTYRELSLGDEIVIINTNYEAQTFEDKNWQYTSNNRVWGLVALCAVFFALIIIIGKSKGVTTILSLILLAGAVFMVYVPAVLCGVNLYVATIVLTVFVVFSSLCILNGYNKKTLCAIVGNLGGIALSGALAYVVNYFLHVNGLISVDYIALTMLGDVSLDLRAVIWSGILIGSLGAVMDVAMSISSAMNELSKEMKDKSYVKMVASGMAIGKDAIGTMTNTLILAYVGSSMATILLFVSYNKSFLMLLNMEMIVVEIIQAVVGSIGILLCVPITVFFSAWIFNKEK